MKRTIICMLLMACLLVGCARQDTPPAGQELPVENTNQLAAQPPEFSEDPVTYNLKVIDKLDPQSTASMQKDMEKGHQSEIQGLLFDMITAAEEQGIEVPTYQEVAKKFRI